MSKKAPPNKRPKSGKIKTFHITCKVPIEYWRAVSKGLGFKEADLSDMMAGMISDLADQAPEVEL